MAAWSPTGDRDRLIRRHRNARQRAFFLRYMQQRSILSGCAVSAAFHAEPYFIIAPQRGELAAPDATGIEAVHAFGVASTERRPVAKDDLHIPTPSLRRRKPRHLAIRLFVGCVFVCVCVLFFVVVVLLLCVRIGDVAQTRPAMQMLIPATRLTAVHMRDDLRGLAAAQFFTHMYGNQPDHW